MPNLVPNPFTTMSRPVESPMVKIKGPIPTVIPLSSPHAKDVYQNCECCFANVPSDRFIFERGLCDNCSALLAIPEE